MDEENSNVIIHPIEICNKLGEIKAPQIECTIRIEDFLIKTYALLDTGCTHVIIDKKIIPKRYNLSRKTYNSTTSKRKL